MKYILLTFSAFVTISGNVSATNTTSLVPISTVTNTTVPKTYPPIPATGSIPFCRKFNGFYETVDVKVGARGYINQLRASNTLEGSCRIYCPTLCGTSPCLASAKIEVMPSGRERCSCPTKCKGLKNAGCNMESGTCTCKEGFWGTNVSSSGCPNKGFYVKPLSFKFSDLEPIIDNTTMFLHHQKHHQAYVDNLNKLLQKSSDISKPILALQPNAIAAGPAIRNNAGGHYNHALFWTILSPAETANKTSPSIQLTALIKTSFGDRFKMVTAFNKLASPATTFGSGWVWLCVNALGNRLVIVNTPNQDNPLMAGVTNGTMFPILGLDVWEHAYYLKYYNLRDSYVSNFWKVVNWTKVSEYAAYAVAKKQGISV